MTKDEALEKKAENARELGLNYEPEPVVWEKVNMREHAEGNLGIGTSPVPQRTWVGLTADEMETLYQQATYMDDTDHIHMLMMAEAKLKEKNHD